MKVPEYMNTLVAAAEKFRDLTKPIRGNDTCIGMDLRGGNKMSIFRNEDHRDVFDIQLITALGTTERCGDVAFHDGGTLTTFLNKHKV